MSHKTFETKIEDWSMGEGMLGTLILHTPDGKQCGTGDRERNGLWICDKCETPIPEEIVFAGELGNATPWGKRVFSQALEDAMGKVHYSPTTYPLLSKKDKEDDGDV